MLKRIILSLTFSVLLTATNAQVINAGVGGNNTAQLLERIDTDVLAKAPDLVILMAGTNDMINRNKILSYEAYGQNYRAIVKQLKDQGIEVLVMSSPTVDSAYVFTRHPRALFEKASPNERLDTARQIIEQIAQDYDLHYLDLNTAFQEIGVPRHDKDLFIRNPENCGVKDGVHPTPLGYHFIAENIFHYMKRHQMIKAEMKIICFGDSITQGQGAKGKGRATGETYPGVLKGLINAYSHKK